LHGRIRYASLQRRASRARCLGPDPPDRSRGAAPVENGNICALGTSDSTTTLTFIIENGAVTGFEANANGIKRILKKIK